MGVCTKCGYLTDDSIQETHECSDAHVLIGKKAYQMAQDQLIADNVIEIGGDGKPKKK